MQFFPQRQNLNDYKAVVITLIIQDVHGCLTHKRQTTWTANRRTMDKTKLTQLSCLLDYLALKAHRPRHLRERETGGGRETVASPLWPSLGHIGLNLRLK